MDKVTGPCNRNDCPNDRVPGSSIVGFCKDHGPKVADKRRR